MSFATGRPDVARARAPRCPSAPRQSARLRRHQIDGRDGPRRRERHDVERETGHGLRREVPRPGCACRLGTRDEEADGDAVRSLAIDVAVADVDATHALEGPEIFLDGPHPALVVEEAFFEVHLAGLGAGGASGSCTEPLNVTAWPSLPLSAGVESLLTATDMDAMQVGVDRKSAPVNHESHAPGPYTALPPATLDSASDCIPASVDRLESSQARSHRAKRGSQAARGAAVQPRARWPSGGHSGLDGEVGSAQAAHSARLAWPRFERLARSGVFRKRPTRLASALQQRARCARCSSIPSFQPRTGASNTAWT
jgi:hypothetical protein